MDQLKPCIHRDFAVDGPCHKQKLVLVFNFEHHDCAFLVGSNCSFVSKPCLFTIKTSFDALSAIESGVSSLDFKAPVYLYLHLQCYFHAFRILRSASTITPSCVELIYC